MNGAFWRNLAITVVLAGAAAYVGARLGEQRLPIKASESSHSPVGMRDSVYQMVHQDIQLSDDGTWRGTVGKASASGTARMRRGRLELSGIHESERPCRGMTGQSRPQCGLGNFPVDLQLEAARHLVPGIRYPQES